MASKKTKKKGASNAKSPAPQPKQPQKGGGKKKGKK